MFQCGLHLCAQDAVMRTLAAATGRQVRVFSGIEHPLEGAESEEEHQQDCEGTPHLT